MTGALARDLRHAARTLRANVGPGYFGLMKTAAVQARRATRMDPVAALRQE